MFGAACSAASAAPRAEALRGVVEAACRRGARAARRRRRRRARAGRGRRPGRRARGRRGAGAAQLHLGVGEQGRRGRGRRRSRTARPRRRRAAGALRRAAARSPAGVAQGGQLAVVREGIERGADLGAAMPSRLPVRARRSGRRSGRRAQAVAEAVLDVGALAALDGDAAEQRCEITPAIVSGRRSASRRGTAGSAIIAASPARRARACPRRCARVAVALERALVRREQRDECARSPSPPR